MKTLDFAVSLKAQFSIFLLCAGVCITVDNPLTKSSLRQHYYAPNSWSSPHTC